MICWRNRGNSIRGIYFVISLLSLETTTYVKTVFIGLAMQTWVKRSDLEIWLCLSLSQAWKIGVLTAKKKGSLTLWRFMAFASHNCLVLTTLYFRKGVVKRAIDVEICRDRLTLSANCVVPLERLIWTLEQKVVDTKGYRNSISWHQNYLLQWEFKTVSSF